MPKEKKKTEGKPKKEMTEAQKQEIDLQNPELQKFFKSAKEAVKDKVTEEDDVVLKWLDKAMKYAPIVLQLIDGFKAGAAAYNSTHQQPQQAQQQTQQLKAPDGWLNMSGLDRLKYKYSRPDWYAAGEEADDKWRDYEIARGRTYL